MAAGGQIHWQEGLFLQPHHLQMMQRNELEQLADERRLAFPYPYGLVEARLAGDELENMRVRFDRLRVIMPSGLDISVPDNADLASLPIEEVFASSDRPFTVYLGVALWDANRANVTELGTAADQKVKRLYAVKETRRSDENTGENPQPVLVRRINARLLLEDDDRSDLEVIPVVKIAHAAGEEVGLPKQDPAFIPPCLVLEGSPVLKDLVGALASQVEASRRELVIQITRGGFSIDSMRGVQFEQMLRLRTLNRFSARLGTLARTPRTTPFEAYLALKELLAELAALHPESDAFEVASYDHDNPALCFGELSPRIRGLLRGVVTRRFLQMPFTLDPQERILIGVLTDEQLKAPSEYFLGIRTKVDPRELAEKVENMDSFKLMPRSLAKNLIRGVKLVEERHPPLELPSQTGLHYFRLMRSDSKRVWERVEQDKGLAIRWPDMETSDYNIILYMIVPDLE